MTQNAKELTWAIKKKLACFSEEDQKSIVQEICRFANMHNIQQKEDISQEIMNVLKNMGVPIYCKGYLYLKDAIEIAQRCKDPKTFKPTHMVYPVIAKKYYTTSNAVRHNINASIDYVWYHGNQVSFRKIFGTSGNKPTCSNFITTIAQYLNNK